MLHDYVHGIKPSLDKPMVAKLLPMAIKIRAFIDDLEEEVKKISKKATYQKKRLLKAQRVLMETNKKVECL